MALNLLFLLITLLSSSALGYDVFILAGQSNMAGRGGIININGTYEWDGITPPECQPNPFVLRLNDELLLEEAREPLHKGISYKYCMNDTKVSGVGPGMPFANTLLKRVPTMGPIILVPCAVGGTNISQWMRGSCLYNRLLTRARAATGEGQVLRGMLWYQGENDVNPVRAKVYKTKLEAFFTDVRADLQSPYLPIIQVALASGGYPQDTPYRDMVRNAQLNTDAPNVRCVDAKGLPLNADGLHLQTRSQVRLGKMMADTYLDYFV